MCPDMALKLKWLEALSARVLRTALSLQTMERVWLKGRPFVAGSEISIADLLYASELDMLRMLETVPVVGAWQHRHASYLHAWLTVPFTLALLASAQYQLGASAAALC